MNPNRMNEIRQNTERIRAEREKEASVALEPHEMLDLDPTEWNDKAPEHWSHKAQEPRFEHDAPALVHSAPSPVHQAALDASAKEHDAPNKEALFPYVTTAHTLPTDAQERKGIPVVTGLLDYFPAALAEVAKVSRAGNDKHNPGEPMHWARGKSMDQADCIGRHLMERGGIDPETGQLHSAQMAWRALALLQLELEEKGAPMARGAR